MRGTNDEQAGEAAVELLQHVAQARRFERAEVFAGAAAQISSRPALSSCALRLAATDALTRITCSAPAAATSRSSRPSAARSIAEAVRFAAPRSFWRERRQVRSGRDRQRQRGGERVERVVAARFPTGRTPRGIAAALSGRARPPKNRGRCAWPSSAKTTSRRASMSWTATSSSRNPGCPRFSASSST